MKFKLIPEEPFEVSRTDKTVDVMSIDNTITRTFLNQNYVRKPDVIYQYQYGISPI